MMEEMKMPDGIKFSELQSTLTLGNNDLAAVSHDNGDSTYTSVKVPMTQLGQKVVNDIDYTQALKTANKKPIGAINELKDELLNIYPVLATSPAAIANFTTDLALPLKSCNVEIKPKQAIGTPSPSNPLPISGTDTITVTQTGKNRGELSENNKVNVSPNASYTFENNGITVTASGTYARVAFGYKVEIGKKYTVSFYGYGTGNFKNLYYNNAAEWGDSYGRTVLTTTRTKYTKTITANSNILFVGFYDTSSGTTGDMIVEDFMIEEGETATTYEPYTAQTQTVSLPSTVYGGEVDVIGGSGESKYALCDLSLQSFSTNQTGSNTYEVTTTIVGKKNGTNNILSNMFEYKAYSDDGNYGMRGYTSSNAVAFRFPISEVSTPQQAKDFLVNNGVQLLYELATPTSITLANPITITALDGVNNVFGDTDGNTSVEYRESVQKYVDDNIAAVQALIL